MIGAFLPRLQMLLAQTQQQAAMRAIQQAQQSAAGAAGPQQPMPPSPLMQQGAIPPRIA